VQSIDASIRKLFPNTGVLLVEKDSNTVTQKSLKEADILIGTQKITSLPVENI
jgi:primosomal protein N'